MNLIEIFVIYLSCGAPLGVYFFLQHKKNFPVNRLWMKSLFTVVVWIPYAAKLVNELISTRRRSLMHAREITFNNTITDLQKKFLNLKTKNTDRLSVFQLREILERYVGLTLACKFDDPDDLPDFEIFRVSLRNKNQLAAKCMHRRVKQRLEFHQFQARTDFLQVISNLKNDVIGKDDLKHLAYKFVETIADIEARNELDNIYNDAGRKSILLPTPMLDSENLESADNKFIHANRKAA